jgi:hypothetical protein
MDPVLSLSGGYLQPLVGMQIEGLSAIKPPLPLAAVPRKCEVVLSVVPDA